MYDIWKYKGQHHWEKAEIETYVITEGNRTQTELYN
jgi:hypothetical protein